MATNDRLLIAQLDVSVRALERSMRKAGVHVDRTTQTMEKRWERMNRKVSQSSNQMAADVRRAIAGIAIGMAAREVVGYADAWTEAGNKIAAAGTPIEQSTERLKELSDTAIATRSSFEATSALYARLGIATEELTGKSYDLLKITELINKATVAGGASTAERNSTVLQLSQALASGQLMGEELRSLRENAPLLMKALAAEFDTTIGKLKDLGAEGKLTAERVLDAIMNAEGEIEDRFSKTNVTIGDSFTNLQTRIIEYIGQADDSIGATEKLTGAIMYVADNVDAFAEALVIAGAALTGALGAQAMVSVVSGLAEVTKGTQGAARAMALLRAASSFIFGPAGIIIGISAAAAALAYMAVKGGDADKAVRGLTDAQKLANTALQDTQKYVDEDLLGQIGESADESSPKVGVLAGKLREVADALNDATIAKFINDVSQLETAISEAEAKIASAEARLEGRDMRRAGNRVDVEEINKELGITRALLAGLEQRRANIGISLFSEGQGKDITDAILSGDVAGASAMLRDAISAKTGGTQSSASSGTSGDGSTKAETSAVKSIEDAWNQAFLSKRQLAEKDYQDTLSEIEGLKQSQAVKDNLAEKALDLRDQKLKEIQREEADGINALVEARDQALGREKDIINRRAALDAEAARQKFENEEDAAKAIALIEEKRVADVTQLREQEEQEAADLVNQMIEARERALGNYEALAQAEYDTLVDKIDKELTAEQGKYVALAALEEAHRKTIKDIRERMADERLREALEEAETLGEGFRAQWDVMRSDAERATAEIGMLFADTFGPGGTVQEAIGDATARAIVFGDSFEESVQRAAESIASDLISALVSYGVQMAMQAALGQTIGASATAASIAQGAATAAAWAPAAAAVSLASFGANAAPAQAGIATTYGLTQALSAVPGYEQGGYTGGGGRKQIAGVVHGQEFVSDAATTASQRGVLEAMRRGLDVQGILDSIPLSVASPTPFVAGGNSSVTVGGSSLVVNGAIDADTLPKVQAMLDRNRREIGEQVRREIAREKTVSTPRHQRERFLKG